MDYQKLDAALVVQLRRAGTADRLTVWVHCDHTIKPEEEAILRQHRVNVVVGQSAFTADLTVDEIGFVSDQPFVKAVRLSTRLRPLTP